METTKSHSRLLKILLTNLALKPIVTSLAKEMKMSRVGAWKVTKRLEAEKLVSRSPMGEGKTSIDIVYLNWENPLVEKYLALSLTEDALRQQRWRLNFRELEGKLDFLIIFGSIISAPKVANDIDILCIVSGGNFNEIERILQKIQKTQLLKIHSLNLTPGELHLELGKSSGAFVEAVKKGVVLFGQERFIGFMRDEKRSQGLLPQRTERRGEGKKA